MLRLRTINRWLRWSGFLLVVHSRGDGTPTLLGLHWFGLPGSKGFRSTAKELSV